MMRRPAGRLVAVALVAVGCAVGLGVARAAPHTARLDRADTAKSTRRSLHRAGLSPAQLRHAYGIDRVASLDGAGVTVAIVSFDTVPNRDVERWDREMGISALPLEHVSIGGGVPGPGRSESEAALDVEMIQAIAPAARIVMYEAPANGPYSIADVIESIRADGRAKIVSLSWGGCEAHKSDGEREREDALLADSTRDGVSVFDASGDSGAYDCRGHDHDLGDHAVSVDWPGASASVIAVGGTFLRLNADGSYRDEAGWESPISWSAGGGGVTDCSGWYCVQKPEWQRGSGLDNTVSHRQLPDVAGPADPLTALKVGYTAHVEKDNEIVAEWSEEPIGGTSAAAPFWAGVAALAQQRAHQVGVGPLGYLNPVLYDIAADAAPGSVFNDVVRGGNLRDRAGPGWDASAGLGTPRVPALIRAIIEHLRRSR